MLAPLFQTVIDRVPGFESVMRNLAKALHKLVLSGGEPARTTADTLHGTWLGHPLHPMLTDVTIGGWTFGTLFDVAGLVTRSEGMREAGDRLTALGTVAALPTALAGVADYSGIKQDSAAHGGLHGAMNAAALTFYLLSLGARKNDDRLSATALASVGLGIATMSAYLGGELSYRRRVGVNHAPLPSGPQEWTAVLPEGDLVEHQAKRVDVEGQPVLLYRYGGTVYAVGAVCAHAGGPLEEGQFDGTCVTCPWHDSVFDLRDGGVVHGPTTYPQPHYRTRILEGQIELRLAERTA